MSWIFGFSGNLSEQKKLSLSSLYPKPQLTIDEPRLFIAAGGNKFNCISSGEEKWILLGTSLEESDGNFRLIVKSDLEKSLAADSQVELGGHYLLIKWDNGKISFSNDKLGLRTVYFHRDKTGVYFSTNLEWIAAIMKKVEINYSEFGSRWMTFNQLSNESFIYDVDKLPPDSSAEIISGVVKIQKGNWFPEIDVTDSEHLFKVLGSLLNLELPEKLKMTFGLSGGLDSRFLLSFLLRDRKQKFNIHSFGYNDDPDLQIAKRISDNLALKCFFLQPSETGSGQFLNKASDYIAATQLIEPFTSYVKLSVLNNRYFEDKFLIDGALAEFARRQFLNRLLIKGRSALLNKNYTDVIKNLIVPKPEIFKEEFNDMMAEGAIEQLKRIYESFPDPKETGPENFVDLLVAKFRIPNYFGPEQSRIDNLFPGIMPFAQQQTITASLSIPVKQRKNSQLFYNAIRENYPPLEDFPLVKDSTIYPYGLSSLTSYAYTKMKKTIAKSESGRSVYTFFKNHENAVREMINRDEIREYQPYDEDSVIRIINDFYSGKNKRTDDLTWLLTFEIFRKKLNITAV
jgi:hypothetical protein